MSATLHGLRKAIIDCAAEATTAEPFDTDRRLHSFIAKLSGTMEGLGELELDATLWNLMKTRSVELMETKADAAEAQALAAPHCMDTPARKPTPDEQMGMDWWNGLTEENRAHWLVEAKSASPFAAWRAFGEAVKRSFRDAADNLATED